MENTKKNDDVSIQDKFLRKEDFDSLRSAIMQKERRFPWYFNPSAIGEEETPGLFSHIVYFNSQIVSEFFAQFPPILEQMNVNILSRINVCLQTKLTEPNFATFHTDLDHITNKSVADQWTVSILYINTNNGYTELKDTGQKIESVANRLVTFPGNLEHRGVSQTDEQTRVLITFNYLKHYKVNK